MTSVSKGEAKRIRVGIIGANPDRGWAAQAHIPALKSLSDDFEITALSTSRRESADAAGKIFGVPLAFDNHQELVNNSAVDVVAVTAKVPHHLELATAALVAGKAVYCEWPLGNGLKEAETLAALAKRKGVLAVAGLQARSAPAVAYVRDLIKQGYVGEVLSTVMIGSGMGWGADGGAVQRLPQRQEQRRDDALDRGRPRSRRPMPLPRRGPRAVGHHDRSQKVLHDRGDGRTQAHDRGRSGVRHRAARGRGRALDPLSRRAFAWHE